jgi:hypothetical protein
MVSEFLFKTFNIDVPYALPVGGWEIWKNDLRKQHPIIYFLTEFVPDIWRSLKHTFITPIYNIVYNIRCRFVKKYYLIDTRLPRTSYYDITEKMLWANFAMLQDYVEIELAQMFEWSNKPISNQFTSSQKGMLYCQYFFEQWESECKKDGCPEDIFNPGYVDSIKQFYKEVYDLYNWWVFGRPIRINAFDLSGYYTTITKYPEYDKRKINDNIPDEIGECYKKINEIETSYAIEDQEMLIRLIKIRERLWT